MSFGRLIKKRSQKPTKIDLKINIENFGPISKGNVELKPLTIFVGPNNSGKSYAAMLIHSILSSENKISIFDKQYSFESQNSREVYQLYHKEIQDVVKKNKGKQSFIIPTSVTKKIISSITQDVFAKHLETTISRNFGSPVNDLIRIKQKTTKIDVSNSNTFNIIINKKLNVKTNSKFNIKYKFQISPKEIDEEYISEKTESDLTTITISKEYAVDFFKFEITDYIIRSISRKIKHKDIPTDSYYFPAARSGILQGHRALSASIIQSASFGGIESYQIPKLTGVVSDFISNIILISNRPGPFFKLAEQLETELLHGHIKLPSRTKGAFPEITYRSENNEIPLHRTSSTISEIAPLSLYLKYIIHSSSLLIIEEPEAHLHPANQLIFAKYIVKLIRSGLNVLVTTHSVFLLEKLGKFMLASKIDPEIREKELGFDINDYISPDEVSPYVFVKDGENEHRIVPIDTNDEEGISQEEFLKVNELLYVESIKLEKNLPSD